MIEDIIFLFFFISLILTISMLALLSIIESEDMKDKKKGRFK